MEGIRNMIESLKKNKKGIALMIISSICACTGQLFWKLSGVENILYLFIGFSLYGLGALVMIYAYRFGELSVLQPVLSLNYVLTLILAKVVLNENISITKILGIIIVMTGVVLIGGGNKS